MIAIIDYGLGNVKAFANVYKRLNLPIVIAKEASALDAATKIILPGVGAFDYAMTLLDNSGMREKLEYCVLEQGVPVLGICVGMQILANSSEEGSLAGLGWITGKVRKFQSEQIHTNPLPHMGWNTVTPKATTTIFQDMQPTERFYFLHSYYFDCDQSSHTIATANYGADFTCSVNKNNIYGVQFHPEKSHQAGVQLLKNFGTL
ncbi:imidazole glycerol phosphate synthase subunit HisH [Thiothrix litoralis]|uniref:Imidazole glycerol phosphate synthase subunit HisH n=1 Tax=Thiothrix litoralis TaxID=2891210 RepID=A0ABX7WRB9_9GAMM|nr:imidazole glycerol phosphate synthase subunit HisH [Thiothrix litoralis]QTR46421.1 imidazole glycerol phosphate synthase subunit HisH [Thiothrix litoralis]